MMTAVIEFLLFCFFLFLFVCLFLALLFSLAAAWRNKDVYYLRKAYIYEVQIWQRPCEQKTLKIWEKGALAYPGTFKIFKYSYYLRNAT